MDKYIAAVKAFWETFADAWEDFLKLLSGKDGDLFSFIRKMIDGMLKIEADETSTEEEE